MSRAEQGEGIKAIVERNTRTTKKATTKRPVFAKAMESADDGGENDTYFRLGSRTHKERTKTTTTPRDSPKKKQGREGRLMVRTRAKKLSTSVQNKTRSEPFFGSSCSLFCADRRVLLPVLQVPPNFARLAKILQISSYNLHQMSESTRRSRVRLHLFVGVFQISRLERVLYVFTMEKILKSEAT